MLPKPVETFTLSHEDIMAMLQATGESGADARERLRAKLLELHAAAMRVYRRANLDQPNVLLTDVVETVLYHYDATNRRAVARELGMDYDALIILLCGYILGQDYRNCLSIWGDYDR